VLKKFKNIIGEIVKQVAISLFFLSLFVLSIYFLFSEKLSNYVFLINRVVIEEKFKEPVPVSFDGIEKRLINYPRYGELFATLLIPKTKVEAIVYHGDSLDLLKSGVGHFSGSYFPGENGTILLAAHNSKEHFKSLPELKEKDEVILKTDYGTFTYEVNNYLVMDASELEKINIQKGYEELVLYTCYPVDTVGFKTKRYVVYLTLTGVTYED